MCQCAKAFWFPAPLWRVIKRGSNVIWMCNRISCSFLLPLFSSPSCFVNLFLSLCRSRALMTVIKSWENWLSVKDVSEAFQRFYVCDINRAVQYTVCTFQWRMCFCGSILAAPVAWPLYPGLLSFLDCWVEFIGLEYIETVHINKPFCIDGNLANFQP